MIDANEALMQKVLEKQVMQLLSSVTSDKDKYINKAQIKIYNNFKIEIKN